MSYAVVEEKKNQLQGANLMLIYKQYSMCLRPYNSHNYTCVALACCGSSVIALRSTSRISDFSPEFLPQMVILLLNMRY